jgi:hypothetical protein
VGRAGGISEALVLLKSAKLLDERGYSSGIRPTAPSHCGEAKKTGAEQRDRRRLGYRAFGDHDLTVAGPEISNQDLVCTRIEGAATTTGTTTEVAGTTTGTTAVAAATAPTWPATTTAAAEAAAARAPSETRECTSPVTAGSVTARAEKAAAATGTAKCAIGTGTAAAAGAAPGPPAVGAGETALAGQRAAHESAATTAAAGNDQGRIARADHETAATASATFIAARAANGDLQRLPCRQAEVAADFGASTAYADETSKGAAGALRTKGENLIGVGGRHREGDEATSIREVERHGAGRRP